MSPADRPARALLVFLDGVGLGPRGPHNPLAVPRPALRRLAGGADWTAEAPAISTSAHVFRPLDAAFGVPGLPQSGTGQAALFGGFDAPGMAGRHFGPHPPTAVRPALAERNVFTRLVRAGVPVEALAFANAFPERFFRYAERLEAQGRHRWTATTFSCRAAGVRLRTGTDLARGDAVAADLTGATWPEPESPPLTTPDASGRALARLAGAHTLTLFEFWLTDKAGHARDTGRADAVLGALDTFFDGVLGALDPDTLLLVTSDHGNLEDLSTKGHTLNPVPLVAHGPGAAALAGATTLADVTPALVRVLTAAINDGGRG